MEQASPPRQGAGVGQNGRDALLGAAYSASMRG
jgi:hypothetical protein